MSAPKAVAVVGSRNYKDLQSVVDYMRTLPAGTLVVTGDASGVDSVALKYAKIFGLPWEVVRPEYSKYPGHIAPKKRNTTIVEKVEHVQAYWNMTDETGGTANVIAKAVVMGRTVKVEVE